MMAKITWTRGSPDLASDFAPDFAQQLGLQDFANLADFFAADFVSVDGIATGLALARSVT
jgi:hypothetical protein